MHVYDFFKNKWGGQNFYVEVWILSAFLLVQKEGVSYYV